MTYPLQVYKAKRFNRRPGAIVRCRYCKRILSRSSATVDHKIPRSRGGLNREDNFCLSCESCNKDKGSMTEEEFLESRRRKTEP